METSVVLFPGILEILKTFFAGGRDGGAGVAEPLGGPAGGAPRRDGGGGDVPTTLPSGQTPGPSRPGTKYPVRGNPSLR